MSTTPWTLADEVMVIRWSFAAKDERFSDVVALAGRVRALLAERDELREALRDVLPLATHGNVCRGCWTVVPMLCEERCELRMAHALLERLSRHPAQPVKGTP